MSPKYKSHPSFLIFIKEKMLLYSKFPTSVYSTKQHNNSAEWTMVGIEVGQSFLVDWRYSMGTVLILVKAPQPDWFFFCRPDLATGTLLVRD